MKKTTIIADGTTRDFYFTGQFFLKSDIIVEVNGQPAVNYNLIPASNGQDADIPFGGGRVCFAKAPKQSDVVTIYRDLPLRRVVDYQPTTRYNPKNLNHDLNYLMALIEDLREDLSAVSTTLSTIINP